MVHQHNLLEVVKPVGFHYFGKAHKEVTLITEPASKYFPRCLAPTVS